VDHPVEVATQSFAEAVAERTDGRITVSVFPGGQLGGEVELQDQVALGTIEAAGIGTPVMSGKLKKLDILNMYYLWEDRDHMEAALAGPIGESLWAEYEDATGIRVIAANWQQGTRHTLLRKAARTPQDFNGVKIRVTAGVPLYNDLWAAMGASPVPLPFPEANPAMTTGVVDAVELPYDWMIKGGFVDLGSHVSLTGHYFYTNVVIVNADWLDSLPADLQQIVIEEAQRAGDVNTELVLESQDQLRAEIEAQGITFVEADYEAFRQSVQPVFRSNMDVWGRDLFDRIQAAAN
jgi:TRAP-type C4-dicarboxylate transport system substrate-binding protein